MNSDEEIIDVGGYESDISEDEVDEISYDNYVKTKKYRKQERERLQDELCRYIIALVVTGICTLGLVVVLCGTFC